MNWQIKLPMRHASEPLDARALHELPQAIDDPTERQVVRGLMLDAAGHGIETVGELAQELDRAPQSKRRAMLDRAREAVGLPTAARADADAQLAMSRATAPIGGGPHALEVGPHGWSDLTEQARDADQAERDRRVLEARRRQQRADRETDLQPTDRSDLLTPANLPWLTP